MRDFILLGIFVGAVPIAIFNPYIGILMWTWIAYFNPHRFTWSYMYDAPVAAVIAVPTILGSFLTRDSNRFFLVRETLLLLCLWAWFGFTYVHATSVPFFAGHTADSRYELVRVSKILLMTVLMIFLVTSHKKLKYLF